MPSNPSWLTQNIKRSVQSYLTAQIPTATFIFDDKRETVPVSGQWINARWGKITPTDLAGGSKVQKEILILDLWSRMISDPLCAALDALADTLRGVCTDPWVALKDYTIPSAPVDSGFKIRLSIKGDDPMPATNLVFGRSLVLEARYIERR